MSDTAKIRDTLMTVLDEDHAEDVIEHRRKGIKIPLTPRSAKRLANELAKCTNPNRAAEIMVNRAWRGFEASWLPAHERLLPSRSSGEGGVSNSNVHPFEPQRRKQGGDDFADFLTRDYSAPQAQERTIDGYATRR